MAEKKHYYTVDQRIQYYRRKLENLEKYPAPIETSVGAPSVHGDELYQKAFDRLVERVKELEERQKTQFQETNSLKSWLHLILIDKKKTPTK